MFAAFGGGDLVEATPACDRGRSSASRSLATPQGSGSARPTPARFLRRAKKPQEQTERRVNHVVQGRLVEQPECPDEAVRRHLLRFGHLALRLQAGVHAVERVLHQDSGVAGDVGRIRNRSKFARSAWGTIRSVRASARWEMEGAGNVPAAASAPAAVFQKNSSFYDRKPQSIPYYRDVSVYAGYAAAARLIWMVFSLVDRTSEQQKAREIGSASRHGCRGGECHGTSRHGKVQQVSRFVPPVRKVPLNRPANRLVSFCPNVF